MVNLSYLAIIILFAVYYFIVLIFERRLISEPRDIIEKFLAITLGYAGISLIYFSLTGNPLFTDSIDEYSIYIFIIGFISVLWSVPNLLGEFLFFKRFIKRKGSGIKQK